MPETVNRPNKFAFNVRSDAGRSGRQMVRPAIESELRF
jgi:hypothetical protein